MNNYAMNIDIDNLGLSNETISAALPAHENNVPYYKRTDKYSLFNSEEIIETMKPYGFVVREAFAQGGQHGKRTPNAAEGGDAVRKHCYRLCLAKDFGKPEMPEIVMVNSHNGSTALTIMEGYFRMVCSNGMIVGGKEVLHVKHMGHTLSEVKDAIAGICDNFGNTFGVIDNWKTRFLSSDEMDEFARRANGLRETIGLKPVEDHRAILGYRRMEDYGNSLWQVFNVAQENLTKGGLYLPTRKSNGPRDFVRRRTTKPLTNITQNLALNKSLWELADEFAVTR